MTDLFFDFLILLLIVHFGRKADCGIPIFKWCIIYFFFLALRSISNYAKVILTRTNASQTFKTVFQLTSFVLVDGGFLVWLIYGNMLFYSSNNACGDSSET